VFALLFQSLVRVVTSNSIDSAPKWVKNGGSKQFESMKAPYGGNVKIARNLRFFGAIALMTAGLLIAGCKSAPELTATQAQALIQAKYDQTPPAGVNIIVDDMGMKQGVTAKYWEGMKKYPNGYWVDLKLTEAGKKVLTLQKGGDVIEWHPEQPNDPKYFIVVTTVATNHLKAHDVADPQDEVGGTKSVLFNEAESLDGVPDPLQNMARNAINKLTAKRTATFAVDGGAWKLQSIH
jgi:hypothetical protein